MSKIFFRSNYLLMFVLVALFACRRAETQQIKLKPADAAPAFTLPSYDGKKISLADFKGKIVVLEWFNRGCPFVVNHYKTGHMQKLQKEFQDKGIVWLTINSTGSGQTDFLSDEKAQDLMKEWKIEHTTMLKDEVGTVGKLYGAKTTPHMYIVDAAGNIAYQGAIDEKSDTSHDPAQTKNFVRENLERLIAGEKVVVAETTPYGCSVKYSS